MSDLGATALVAQQSEEQKALERKLRNEWETPVPKYYEACNRWDIQPAVDVAANGHNKKCAVFINEEMNALKTDWIWFANQQGLSANFFMNPPFNPTGFMTKFIEQAIAVAERGGHTLFILPASVEQKWYHKLIKQFPHEFFEGRVNFLPPPGIKPSHPRSNHMHGVITRPKVQIVMPELTFQKAKSQALIEQAPTIEVLSVPEFDWGSLR